MRRVVLFALVAGSLLAGGLSASASAAGLGPRELDVMTFNMASAAFTGNDLEVLSDVISSEDPDVVALEEVDQSWSRSDSVDQAQDIAKRLGMNVAFGAAYNCVARDADGDDVCRYGIALLSRFPFVPGTVTRLPLPRADNGETRMAIRALLDVRGRHVQIVVTHLAVEQPSRELQVPALMRFARAYGGPTIITGDFNALSNAPELRSLRKRYRDAQQISELRTRTARGGRIDYVYVTRNIDVLGARVGPAGFSDHRPLVAELRLPR